MSKATSYRLPDRTREQIAGLAEVMDMTNSQVLIVAIDRLASTELTDRIETGMATMKAVIGGKRYDTTTAQLVAEAHFGYAGDFQAFSEGLYKTKRGAWFLAGEGGAMSHYASSLSDGSRSGGERIIPLDSDDALAWLERNQENEAIEIHFSDSIEDA